MSSASSAAKVRLQPRGSTAAKLNVDNRRVAAQTLAAYSRRRPVSLVARNCWLPREGEGMMDSRRGSLWRSCLSILAGLALAFGLSPTVAFGASGGPSMSAPTTSTADRWQTTGPAASSSGFSNWAWQNPLPQGNRLGRVSCPSANACAAVGSNGSLITTTNGGAGWSLQNTNANTLYDISCPTTSTCFAVGVYGGIVRTNDFGTTWTSQVSHKQIDLFAISCPTSTVCMVAGASGTLLATNDGGVNWISQPSGPTGGISFLSCPSVSICFGATAGGLIAGTINFGASWSTLIDRPGEPYSSIDCPSVTTCFVVGSTEVIATKDGGVTWHLQTSGTQAPRNNVSCATVTDCALTASLGQIATTHDGGATWSARTVTIWPLAGVSCPTSTTCFVVGWSGLILNTIDGGTAWTRQGSGTMSTLHKISCQSPSACLVAGDDGILGTSDGGQTWSYRGPTSPFLSITCASADTCIAVGGSSTSGIIFASHDGGANWASRATTPNPLWSVSCPTASICFAVGQVGTILTSGDGGDSWSSQVSGSTKFLDGVSCPNATTCVVVGQDGVILGTKNGGTTWSSLPTATGDWLNGISCPDLNFCLAAGRFGTVVRTVDGGQRWSAGGLGTHTLYDVSCSSADSCMVVGYNGEVFGGSGLQQNSGADAFLYGVSCVKYRCWVVGDGGAILWNQGGIVKPNVSTASANPDVVVADGTSTSTVTVTLKDINLNPVDGRTVTLAKSSGPGSPSIVPASAVTNAVGAATFAVSSTTEGQDFFTAVDTTDAVTVDQKAFVTFYQATGGGPPVRSTAVSTIQYSLRNSNGQTWLPIDPTNLSLTLKPTVDSNAIVTANADLWTTMAGVNQDLGIFISGGSYASGVLYAWKESGGYAGTFSPNAAFVQTVIPLVGGQTYTVLLEGKANRANRGTIVAAAGAGPSYSPTRVSAELLPSSDQNLKSGFSTKQYTQVASDGTTWKDLDDTGLLTTQFMPSSDGLMLASGNVDLWTQNSGVNQDIGVFVSGGTFAAGEIVGWKESGGNGGTFSPNAAYLQTAVPLIAATPYTFKLQWKTNLATRGTIRAGAGAGPQYSPTRLTLHFFPAATGLIDSATNQQYTKSGSTGADWVPIDGAGGLRLGISPTTDSDWILGANADLWTADAGVNQDIGIFVNGDEFGGGTLVGWKESGGFAGTYSPNAAFVQVVLTLKAGHHYTVVLDWKANHSTGGTIFAAAGQGPNYSPTRVTAQLVRP
jgi:photosystem II stability/assembly factor-like uncharacterized protein